MSTASTGKGWDQVEARCCAAKSETASSPTTPHPLGPASNTPVLGFRPLPVSAGAACAAGQHAGQPLRAAVSSARPAHPHGAAHWRRAPAPGPPPAPLSAPRSD